jgi:hypothetical protein
MIVWFVLGCLLLAAAVAVIAYLDGASLGPYSTRLLAMGVLCAGYYGAFTWLRFGQSSLRALHWPWLRYALPSAAGAGAIYCAYRIATNWRAEVHGLAKTFLKLVLLVLLGALAWLCFTR